MIKKEYFLNADTDRDRDFQLKLLQALNSVLKKEGTLDADEFEIFLEDALGRTTLSVRRAADLLRMTGAYTCGEDGWKYKDDLKIDGQVLSFEDYLKIFEEENEIGDLSEASVSAAARGIAWTVFAAQLAEAGGLKGMPAFFACDDEKDSLIGVNVAGTATSDALSLMSQSPGDLFTCGRSADEIAGCLSFLLDRSIACQCTEEGWDKGGFYPWEDQPESEHPTVDATCLAVLALCSFYEHLGELKEGLGKQLLVVDLSAIEEAILEGLGFLFRMRLDNGSFGIYEYENGLEASPNENCTRMVQYTMGVCKGCGVFDSMGRFDMYPRCSDVIQGTYAYLTSHMAEAGEYGLWTPYYGSRVQDYSAADVAVSTARVCRSFLPVWWQMEDERENIIKYNRDFLCWWRDNEDRIAAQVGRYRFLSPAKNAFSTGEYFWAARTDMLAAFTVLQAHNMFGLQLSDEDWQLIDRAVRRTLALQHPHGHWDNPLARKTPFCAVTLAAVELLQEYRKAKVDNCVSDLP